MKKTRMRKIALLMMGILTLSLLFGCGSSEKSADQKSSTEEKETVSIALWGNQLLESYAPWLQEQFPEVNLDFYVINNSTDYYKFRAAHEDLPDILTVRRFSLRDVESFKDELMDLSDTELANTFYQSYLRNYTYEDGVVNWLPACAEVDDLIVNKTLFEENDIPLPTDYESFIYACQAFESLGIRGFATDFAQDYTCMEVLQGLSVSQLCSIDGRNWRQQYESGTVDGLDKEVWLPVFEKMEDFIEKAGLDASDLSLKSSEILEDFDQGKIAMYRGTGADLTSYGNDYEKLMLPYPGDTEEESWYLTYPAFQVAASAENSRSRERQELILEIMDKMLCEEGLQYISEGKNMIAYNKDVHLTLMEEFSNLTSYIDKNQIYIRLASSDMFSVSKDVVTKMITGELADAKSAYREFDRQMTETENTEEEKAVTIEKGYSREFVSGKGNQAASAIYNTVREELGADVVLGQSALISGDIYAGEYTEKELDYLMPQDKSNLLSMTLTGAEIEKLLQYMLEVEGSRDSVANDSTLPAISGLEVLLKKDGQSYQLEKVTANGETLDPEETRTVILNVPYLPDLEKLQEAGFTEYKILDDDIRSLVSSRLLSGKQLSAPTDYITVE